MLTIRSSQPKVAKRNSFTDTNDRFSIRGQLL
jgi:hypothetical protein